MSRLLEEISSHPLQVSLQELENKLTKLETTLEKPRENELNYLERLKAINAYVKHRVNAADPILVPSSQLDAIDSVTRQQITQLNSFVTGRNIQQLMSANTSADNAIVQISNIPYVQTTDDIEQIRETIVGFRRSVAQHLRNVKEDFAPIRKEVASANKQMLDLHNTVEKEKLRIDKVVTDYQEQFSSAEEGRREAFVASETTRASQTADFEKQREQSFSSFIDKAKKEAETQKVSMTATVDRAAASATNMTQSFTKEAKDIMAKLGAFEFEARKLVGVIGTTGIIHGYQEAADNELGTARRWERVASGAMVLLALFGLYAFWLAHLENFNWHFLAARAMAVIPLGVFAAYAAHKAEQHREVERHNRKMELELAAISPYLATLPDTIQHEIKRLLAERFFANDGRNVQGIRPPQKSEDSSELLKTTLENVKLVLETVVKQKA